MEHLFNYINEAFVIEELNAIDSEIICESLNCKVLKEVAAQLLNYNKAEQANINKRKKEYEEEGRTWWGNDKASSKKFSEIFGGSNFQYAIMWDKITESDITVIDASSWDEFEGRNSANIRKVLNSKNNSMLFVYDNGTNKYKFVIMPGGRVIQLDNSSYRYKIGSSWEAMNQKDKIAACKNCTLYYINLGNKMQEYTELVSKRYKEKQGMINMDPDSLYRIAKQNKERYEKILTKAKSLNVNNDALLDKCNDIIQKVAKLTTDVAKDPITNADLITPLGYLTEFIYDKQTWEQTGRSSGHYKGSDGLFPLIMNYIRSVKYASAEGWSYSLKSVKTYKDKIENILNKIDKFCKERNIQL